MPIRKSVATVEALERLVRVMQARFGAELDAIADDGLRLLTPSDGDYYLPGGYLSDQIMHASIAVVIQQAAPARTRAVESGDGEDHTLVVELPVSVRLLFATQAYEPLDRIGREQTQPEHAAHAAERYKGAIIECLSAYAPDGQAVDELRLTSDVSGVGRVEGAGQLRGEAYTEWTIVHEALMPSDIRFNSAADAVVNP